MVVTMVWCWRLSTIKDGVVDKVVITNVGQQYIPNTTETDLEGNVKEVTPDPNANYDGKTSYGQNCLMSLLKM